jgi:hypothetical protein
LFIVEQVEALARCHEWPEEILPATDLICATMPEAAAQWWGLCAHAPNPTMHRISAANTATFNTASIIRDRAISKFVEVPRPD